MTKKNNHSVHLTPPPHSTGGVEPPTKFLKTAGLTGPLGRKRGVTFFRGGCNFYKKIIKSEIFNEKKV